MEIVRILFTASFLATGLYLKPVKADYRVGVGIADCTGPAAGVNFMGYANIDQQGTGLHLRQFARAYIISDGLKRFAFVSVDVGMIGYGMREEVIANLAERYQNMYSTQNLIISGTHTHGSPGGFMEHLLFDLTVFGFVKQTYDGLVSGITKAVIKAHERMVQAKIFFNSGELLDGNINRSPASYLRNPEVERQQYEYDVDKTMTQLKFVSMNTDKIIGVINWFPVHPVSMNYSNQLITSDNVGYASLLLEKYMNDDAFPGKGDVVAGFASTNLGDVSPNINGAICIDTGEECDSVTSTCNGETQYCIASGPGENMFESTKIIGERLFQKSLELLTAEDAREITGAVDVIHQFIDMPSQEVTYSLGNGTEINGRGCSAAMGYSFAAGTTDGPGPFYFTQGMTSGEENWDFARDLLAQPTDDDVACHAPKPILLATGKLTVPYDWQPSVVSSQLAVIGDVAIAAVPGELTTMAGRRLKNFIRSTMISNGAPPTTTVIISGLSNHYTDYITTYEEYQLQRFEGAATIYGPHTLGIHMVQYEKLTTALMQHVTIDDGPAPPSFDTGDLISLVPGVIFDMYDLTNKFGFCNVQPPLAVSVGSTVKVVFVSGHPRNNLLHDQSFLLVERLVDDEWVTVATDAVWETRFTWKRTFLAASEVIIEWDIDENVIEGTYRIRHFGYAKSLFGGAVSYEGSTRNFEVLNDKILPCSAICPVWQSTTLVSSLITSYVLML